MRILSALLVCHLQYQDTQYSRLFTEWVTPDHAIMHVHFSSGITLWKRVLKQLVNTQNFHGDSVDKWCVGSG